jgi:hypothetical protein
MASVEDLDSFFHAYDHLKAPFERQWLGETGASIDDIALSQERLGVDLPLDYAAFLHASNGWISPGFHRYGYLLSPIAEVDLFSVRNAKSLEILLEGGAFHFVENDVERALDSTFLRRTFQISDDDNSAILLFDPDGGDRMFWHQDFHGPCHPFPSFTAMMQFAKEWADGDFAEVLEFHQTIVDERKRSV